VVEPKPAPAPAKDAEIATEKKPKKKEEPKKEEPRKEEPKKAEVKKPDPKPEPDKKAEDRQKVAEKTAEQAARDKTDAARAQQMRQEQMQRLNAQLLGAGAAAGTSGGTAAQSSGPSASYQGRVVARIRPNIIFSGQVAGHPKAEVSIRVAPDGTILSKRLTKSSGIPEWDDAVLRAIDRTEVLPRDVDGSVPPAMVIGFDPNER
jgi:colicin import membrane protein